MSPQPSTTSIADAFVSGDKRRLSGLSVGILKGIAVAAGSFVVLGTAAALWDNPLFVRMTPSSIVEIVFLAIQSMLIGIYVAIGPQACRVPVGETGSVASFLGIACPTCNKLLMLAFGADALMTYLEPVRIYLAAGGAGVTAIGVYIRARQAWFQRPLPDQRDAEVGSGRLDCVDRMEKPAP